MLSTNIATPAVIGLYVDNNTMQDVFRGVNVSGFVGFQTAIRSNNITIIDDNVYGVSQNAIELTNTHGANNAAGQSIIQDNNLSGSGTGTANTLASLVYCSENSGVSSPSVICNFASSSYNGFHFNKSNFQSVWQGNQMNPVQHGLAISGNQGKIGPQGGAAFASNNQWLTSGWNATLNHYQTYIYLGASAVNSKLYVAPTKVPTINSGAAGVQLFQKYGPSNTLSVVTGGGFDCMGFASNRVISLPASGDYSLGSSLYNDNSVAYRELFFNDSVLISSGTYGTFYGSFEDSTIAKFLSIEEKLFNEAYSEANIVLSAIDPINDVESTYADFYGILSLYVEKKLAQQSLSATDLESLLDLANRCPAEYGPGVYQARALYGLITREPLVADNCGSSSDRKRATSAMYDEINLWNPAVFPNPFLGKFKIRSNSNDTEYTAIVQDLTGRTIIEQSRRFVNGEDEILVNLSRGTYLLILESPINGRCWKKIVSN